MESSLPPASFNKAVSRLVEAVATSRDAERLRRELRKVRAYRLDSRADNRVSLQDGLLLDYTSIKRFEMALGGQAPMRSTETKTVRRLQ